MARKKVAIKPKSKKAAPTKAADEWIEGKVLEEGKDGSGQGQGSENQKMKRLTIDVSEDLHRRIKVGCASKGVKMADVVRGLLEGEFGGSA